MAGMVALVQLVESIRATRRSRSPPRSDHPPAIAAQAIGRQTSHAGRTTVTITSSHGEHERARTALTPLPTFSRNCERLRSS
jgi:hypothetical protein